MLFCWFPQIFGIYVDVILTCSSTVSCQWYQSRRSTALLIYDGTLLAARRGTEVKEKSDVKADLDLKFVEHGAGKVHRGFKTESNKLMDEIFEWVKVSPMRSRLL